ncbi:MAG: hypothetical protein Q7W02_27900 [Candidatus Rokubacteria bacterium]|nr:hypothetical protein [Candidatus Rokubacteria bacterium]
MDEHSGWYIIWGQVTEVVMVAWTIMAVPFVVVGRVPLAEPSSSLSAGHDP